MFGSLPLLFWKTSSGGTSYPHTGSGGITLAGAAVVALIHGTTASGGITLSGSATTSYVSGGGTSYPFVASGGVNLSGAATIFKNHVISGSGGITLAGTATTTYIPAGLATQLSITELLLLQVRLDVKQITDSGQIAAVSTDVGGTVVSFNKAFKDIDSIVATVQQTVRREVVVDFVDAPNPTDFKVLVFDSTGARVSDTVYWVVRGIG